MTSFEQAILSSDTLSPALTVPATLDQLAALRSVVGAVAARYEVSVDGLCDLVLAVDEAASTLICHAHPSSSLTCVVDIAHGDNLGVFLSVTTTAPINSSTSSFGWFVMQKLVDSVVLEQHPHVTSHGWMVTIVLNTALQADS